MATINLKVQTPGSVRSNKRPKSGELQRKHTPIKYDANETEFERLTLNKVET